MKSWPVRAPVTNQNDPERALRAALEMMETLEKFNKSLGLNLGLHFGVNTGAVIAGDRVRDRHDYSVMGDAVNVAARLEDKSERGEILVGQDTYRLTEPLFLFQEKIPFRVKGKAEPLRVYRLLGLKAEPGPVRGLASHNIRSPLVGRDARVCGAQEPHPSSAKRAGRYRVRDRRGRAGEIEANGRSPRICADAGA